MIRSFRTAAAVLLFLAAQAQAGSRAITHEDVWLMKRIGAPVVSPDGRWIAFSVTEPAYERDEQWADLWLVPADGSAPPRRLTATRRGESGLAWSPDSRKLAFSTRREDDQADQIYILDIAGGGEAQRLTQMSGGARAPLWRPDGAAVLFTSMVFPEAATEAENSRLAAERSARRYNARVYDSAPIRHWDRWLDERRPSLFVQSLDPRAEPRNLLGGTQLMRGAGFGGRLENEGEVLDAAWTADGTGLVFAATVNRHQWAYADNVHALWLVPASGGEPVRLTADSHSYRAPQFSRDGRFLYAVMQPHGERVYNLRRLVQWDWPELGASRVLSAELDRSVDVFALAQDGSRVFFLAEDGGRHKLFGVSARGGAVREVGALQSGAYTGLTAGGRGSQPVLAAAWESAVVPREVGRIDPRSGKWQALTSFNAARAAQIDWQPLREFVFTSSRGHAIHNFLALPPGFDETKSYPLFVLIHGGPHTMWRDEFVLRWNYHLLAAPGYVVLLTNYSGSSGFGERFSQRIQGDPLEGPALEINEAAAEAIRRFRFIDGSRQAAGGASYGGHLTNWLAVTTTRYKALISHAGLFDLKTQWSTSDVVYARERNLSGPFWADIPLWREQSPLYRASQLKTPMLVTVGEKDYRVPMNNAMELWTVLQRQQVPSRFIIFPDENHWVLQGENSRFFYSEVHAWLARFL